jgi:hypothetical protein
VHKPDHLLQGQHLIARLRFATAKLAPHWLWLVATLSLVIGTQPAVTKAQQPRVVDYDMIVDTLPRTICFGESTSYTMRILLQILSPGEKGADIIYVSGVDASAEIADSTIVTNTSVVPSHVDLSDPEALEPFTIEFSFKAQKKIGSTAVRFRAVVDTLPVKRLRKEVQVKVVACKYKVTALFNWTDPSGYFRGQARTDETVLTPDADGNLTGSASIDYSGHITCIDQGSLPFSAISGVQFIGKDDGSGHITVKMIFPEVDISFPNCYHNKPKAQRGIVAPLNFTVPSTGGGIQQHSVFRLTDWSASGPAVVTVTRLNPDSGQ